MRRHAKNREEACNKKEDLEDYAKAKQQLWPSENLPYSIGTSAPPLYTTSAPPPSKATSYAASSLTS